MDRMLPQFHTKAESVRLALTMTSSEEEAVHGLDVAAVSHQGRKVKFHNTVQVSIPRSFYA